MSESFHAATLLLLHVDPVATPQAAAELQATERRLGVTLPASVREWYCFDDACEILQSYSNEDIAIPLEEWQAVIWQEHQLLPFRAENQGVCVWAVLLDGTDDPPVWIDRNNDGQKWEPCAATFSEFVLTCIWDWTRVLECEHLMLGYPQAIDDVILARIRAEFDELPQTRGWPGLVTYRFDRGDHTLLIWHLDHDVNLHIAASDTDSLNMLAEACGRMGLCEVFEPTR